MALRGSVRAVQRTLAAGVEAAAGGGYVEVAAVVDVVFGDSVRFDDHPVSEGACIGDAAGREVDAEDVVLSKESGNGDAVVAVTVPAATAARDIKVSFTAKGVMAGIDVLAGEYPAKGKLTCEVDFK